MLLTKEVEIKLNNNTISHYHNLGYKGKAGDLILVDVNHLTKGSHFKVDVLCDYCNEVIITIPYYNYINELKCIDKIACKNCKGKKQKDCTMKKYGVTNTSQLQEVKDKIKNTNLEKYGIDNYAKTKECKEKMKSTCEEKYGKNYKQLFIEKSRLTFYEKTGFSHASKSPDVKEKKKNSFLKKYGVCSPSQAVEIREKITQSFYKNSSQKASTQQCYICNLYDGILNYPVSYYNADIYLPDYNLICEFDGGGHNLNVIAGRETQEEFNQKEIIRNNVIKREGYKQMRIISTTDKLPSDKILLQMLEHTKEYFSNYPEHSWIEFNIDTSSIRNAEQKEGVFFDYGELRCIKKEEEKNLAS